MGYFVRRVNGELVRFEDDTPRAEAVARVRQMDGSNVNESFMGDLGDAFSGIGVGGTLEAAGGLANMVFDAPFEGAGDALLEAGREYRAGEFESLTPETARAMSRTGLASINPFGEAGPGDAARVVAMNATGSLPFLAGTMGTGLAARAAGAGPKLAASLSAGVEGLQGAGGVSAAIEEEVQSLAAYEPDLFASTPIGREALIEADGDMVLAAEIAGQRARGIAPALAGAITGAVGRYGGVNPFARGSAASRTLALSVLRGGGREAGEELIQSVNESLAQDIDVRNIDRDRPLAQTLDQTAAAGITGALSAAPLGGAFGALDYMTGPRGAGAPTGAPGLPPGTPAPSPPATVGTPPGAPPARPRPAPGLPAMLPAPDEDVAPPRADYEVADEETAFNLQSLFPDEAERFEALTEPEEGVERSIEPVPLYGFGDIRNQIKSTPAVQRVFSSYTANNFDPAESSTFRALDRLSNERFGTSRDGGLPVGFGVRVTDTFPDGRTVSTIYDVPVAESLGDAAAAVGLEYTEENADDPLEPTVSDEPAIVPRGGIEQRGAFKPQPTGSGDGIVTRAGNQSQIVDPIAAPAVTRTAPEAAAEKIEELSEKSMSRAADLRTPASGRERMPVSDEQGAVEGPRLGTPSTVAPTPGAPRLPAGAQVEIDPVNEILRRTDAIPEADRARVRAAYPKVKTGRDRGVSYGYYRLGADAPVNTPAGPIEGKAGDIVVIGPAGEMSVESRETFEDAYTTRAPVAKLTAQKQREQAVGESTASGIEGQRAALAGLNKNSEQTQRALAAAPAAAPAATALVTAEERQSQREEELQERRAKGRREQAAKVREEVKRRQQFIRPTPEPRPAPPEPERTAKRRANDEVRAELVRLDNLGDDAYQRAVADSDLAPADLRRFAEENPKHPYKEIISDLRPSSRRRSQKIAETAEEQAAREVEAAKKKLHTRLNHWAKKLSEQPSAAQAVREAGKISEVWSGQPSKALTPAQAATFKQIAYRAWTEANAEKPKGARSGGVSFNADPFGLSALQDLYAEFDQVAESDDGQSIEDIERVRRSTARFSRRIAKESASLAEAMRGADELIEAWARLDNFHLTPMQKVTMKYAVARGWYARNPDLMPPPSWVTQPSDTTLNRAEAALNKHLERSGVKTRLVLTRSPLSSDEDEQGEMYAAYYPENVIAISTAAIGAGNDFKEVMDRLLPWFSEELLHAAMRVGQVTQDQYRQLVEGVSEVKLTAQDIETLAVSGVEVGQTLLDAAETLYESYWDDILTQEFIIANRRGPESETELDDWVDALPEEQLAAFRRRFDALIEEEAVGKLLQLATAKIVRAQEPVSSWTVPFRVAAQVLRGIMRFMRAIYDAVRGMPPNVREELMHYAERFVFDLYGGQFASSPEMARALEGMVADVEESIEDGAERPWSDDDFPMGARSGPKGVLPDIFEIMKTPDPKQTMSQLDEETLRALIKERGFDPTNKYKRKAKAELIDFLHDRMVVQMNRGATFMRALQRKDDPDDDGGFPMGARAAPRIVDGNGQPITDPAQLKRQIKAEWRKRFPGKPLASFKGVNARNLTPRERMSLQRAKALKEDGKDKFTIWRETRWAQTRNGKWAARLDARDVQFTEGFHQWLQLGKSKKRRFRLSNAISSPQLFNAYPELRNWNVTFQFGTDEGIYVYLDPRRGITFTLDRDFFTKDATGVGRFNEREALKLVAHEVAHIIQYIEGFENGASADEMLDHMRAGRDKWGALPAYYIDLAKELLDETRAADWTKVRASALYLAVEGEVAARDAARAVGYTDEQMASPPAFLLMETISAIPAQVYGAAAQAGDEAGLSLLQTADLIVAEMSRKEALRPHDLVRLDEMVAQRRADVDESGLFSALERAWDTIKTKPGFPREATLTEWTNRLKSANVESRPKQEEIDFVFDPRRTGEVLAIARELKAKQRELEQLSVLAAPPVEAEKIDVSRRGFLKGIGAVAAVAGVKLPVAADTSAIADATSILNWAQGMFRGIASDTVDFLHSDASQWIRDYAAELDRPRGHRYRGAWYITDGYANGARVLSPGNLLGRVWEGAFGDGWRTDQAAIQLFRRFDSAAVSSITNEEITEIAKHIAPSMGAIRKVLTKHLLGLQVNRLQAQLAEASGENKVRNALQKQDLVADFKYSAETIEAIIRGNKLRLRRVSDSEKVVDVLRVGVGELNPAMRKHGRAPGDTQFGHRLTNTEGKLAGEHTYVLPKDVYGEDFYAHASWKRDPETGDFMRGAYLDVLTDQHEARIEGSEEKLDVTLAAQIQSDLVQGSDVNPKSLPRVLMSTEQATRLGVWTAMYEAAVNGRDGVAIPTGETVAEIQGWKENLSEAQTSVANYYDTTVRDVANKLAARYGAEVAETDATGRKHYLQSGYVAHGDAQEAPVWIMRFTPETRAKIVRDGHPVFARARRRKSRMKYNPPGGRFGAAVNPTGQYNAIPDQPGYIEDVQDILNQLNSVPTMYTPAGRIQDKRLNKPLVGGVLDAVDKTGEQLLRKGRDALFRSIGQAAPWLGHFVESYFPFGGVPDKAAYEVYRSMAQGRAGQAQDIASDVAKAVMKSLKIDSMQNTMRALAGDYSGQNEIADKIEHVRAFLTARKLSELQAAANALNDQELIDALTIARRTILDVGRALVEHNIIHKNQFMSKAGRDEADLDSIWGGYMRRAYMEHFEQIRPSAGIRASGALYRYKRSSLPESERLLKGEIKDIPTLIYLSIEEPLRDIAIYNFFNAIMHHSMNAPNQPKWFLPESLVLFGGKWRSVWYVANQKKQNDLSLQQKRDELTNLGGARASGLAATRLRNERAILEQQSQDMQAVIAQNPQYAQMLFAGKLPDGYRQIPDNPAVFGDAAGAVVMKQIYDDVMGGTKTIALDKSDPGEKVKDFYLALNRHSKFLLTVANIPTHFRNFYSNIAQLNRSGTNAARVLPAAVELFDYMTTGKRSASVDAAIRYGAMKQSFTEAELRAMDEFTRRLTTAEKRARGHEFAKKNLGMLQPIWNLSNEGRFALGAFVRLTGDHLSAWYQMGDVLFKVAKIADELDRGTPPALSALEARKWFFDYSAVNPWVRLLRSYALAPFISYIYFAIPTFLDTATAAPWRILPQYMLYFSLLAMAASMFGFEDDEARKTLNENMEHRVGLGMMPRRDEHGRLEHVDFGYVLPEGSLLQAMNDVSRGDPGKAMASIGFNGGPIASSIAGLMTGIDPFRQMPIWNETDDAGTRNLKGMSYVARTFTPSLVNQWAPPLPGETFGGSSYESVFGAGIDRQGNPSMTNRQIALRVAGVNAYANDVNIGRQRRMNAYQHDIREAETLLRSLYRDQRLYDESGQLTERGERAILLQSTRVNALMNDMMRYLEETENIAMIEGARESPDAAAR